MFWQLVSMNSAQVIPVVLNSKDEIANSIRSSLAQDEILPEVAIERADSMSFRWIPSTVVKAEKEELRRDLSWLELTDRREVLQSRPYVLLTAQEEERSGKMNVCQLARSTARSDQSTQPHLLDTFEN